MDQKVDHPAAASPAETIARNILPDVLAVAFEAGGWEAVKGLTAAFGGKRISIPLHAGDHHPLVVAGGRKAADAIVRRFGGNRKFSFPRASHSLKLLVVGCYADLSVNALAEKLGCTYRHAGQLRQEAKAGKDRARRHGNARPRDPRQIDIEDIL